MKSGYDIEITRRISEAVPVPVVASGGAGHVSHMADVLLFAKADAALAAGIFHSGEFTVRQAKEHFVSRGIPVRL
jgi:cyclase